MTTALADNDMDRHFDDNVCRGWVSAAASPTAAEKHLLNQILTARFSQLCSAKFTRTAAPTAVSHPASQAPSVTDPLLSSVGQQWIIAWSLLCGNGSHRLLGTKPLSAQQTRHINLFKRDYLPVDGAIAKAINYTEMRRRHAWTCGDGRELVVVWRCKPVATAAS